MILSKSVGKLVEPATIGWFTLVLTIGWRTFVWPTIGWPFGWFTLVLTMGGRIFVVPIIGWLEVVKFLTVVVVVEVAPAVPNCESVAEAVAARAPKSPL